MKKGLRPTRSQKLAMKAVGLNSANWLYSKRYMANYIWYIGKQAQLELFQVIKGGEINGCN
ncbi:hypothetical protein NX021_15470 [Cytobacillus firmus]|nr:hypothetical protein [Cytobacillus firmus]